MCHHTCLCHHTWHNTCVCHHTCLCHHTCICMIHVSAVWLYDTCICMIVCYETDTIQYMYTYHLYVSSYLSSISTMLHIAITPHPMLSHRILWWCRRGSLGGGRRFGNRGQWWRRRLVDSCGGFRCILRLALYFLVVFDRQFRLAFFRLCVCVCVCVCVYVCVCAHVCVCVCVVCMWVCGRMFMMRVTREACD